VLALETGIHLLHSETEAVCTDPLPTEVCPLLVLPYTHTAVPTRFWTDFPFLKRLEGGVGGGG